MKKILVYILILAMSLGLCGCSLVSEMNQTQVTRESANVLHLALDRDIESPDVQTGGSREVAANIYNRLLKLTDAGDGSVSIEGDLAESWDVSADGTSYTFHLREGVRFHNDEEFEADDVLFTIDRMLNPETGAVANDAALRILGAYDIIYGASDTVEDKGVTITDKYTVVITLSEPWSPFLTAICDVSWSIYNRDAKDTGAYSIGTGPYIFDEWVEDDYIFLRVNDHYFEGKAPINGVLYRVMPLKYEQTTAFFNGEIDIVDVEGETTLVNSCMKDETCRDYLVARKQLNTYFYAMNQNLAPYTERNVRLGLQKAIDRKALLAAAFDDQGTILNGILPTGMLGYNHSIPRIKYNKEDALKLIADAGYTEGFSLIICQTGLDEKESALNALTAEQLSQCGINATVRTMEPAAYYSALTSGNIPMHLCCVTSDFNDPDEIIGKAFGSIENVRYSMNIADRDVITRADNALNIYDLNQRMEEYQAIEEQIVGTDACIIPLFQIYSYLLVNPRVGGFDSSTDCVYGFTLK